MQIVIDIDENVFTRLFDNGIEDYAIVNDDLFTIAKSIRNCTPLPKGHGRLVDADEVGKYVIIGNADLRKCPTVIVADKEG